MRLLWQNRCALVVAVLILVPSLLCARPAGQTDEPAGHPAPAPTPAPAPRVLVLEEILITGNRHLSDEAILDVLHLSPGDTINVEVLERERLCLLDTHSVLSDVSLFPRPGSVRGAVVLEIEIVERKTFSLETGYGYHDVNGWFLTLIGLRFDPLYRTDSRLRLGLRFGFNLVSLDAEWEKPPPVGGGLGYDARFYVRTEDRRFFGGGRPGDPGTGGEDGYTWDGPEWNEFRQKIRRSGGEVSALYAVGETRFSFGARVESAEPESTFLDVERDETRELEDFPTGLKGDIEQTLVTGFFFRMSRDTRDHVIYPRSGSFALLSMETNNTLLGGDEIFSKVVLDYRKLTDLGGDRVLSGRLYGGITSSGTPYYERFTLGGIYSVRGFRELSLSPTAGDDGFWMASCELRFPLIRSTLEPPRLSGLAFFDIGQGWQRGHALSGDNLQSAAGYGVRLRLPWLGMLGFDVGIPFSAGRTEENFRIHGSVGFSF